MRRTLLTIMCCIMALPMAAQLNMKKNSERHVLMQNANLNCQVCRSDSAYYLSFKTTNQYDDPMMFWLGYNWSAVASMNDLLKFIDSDEESVTVELGIDEDFRHDRCYIGKGRVFGPCLSFSFMDRVQAGDIIIASKQFVKFRDAIEEDLERRKVRKPEPKE